MPSFYGCKDARKTKYITPAPRKETMEMPKHLNRIPQEKSSSTVIK
jgi:hypothetical protein